ncbi:tube fusion [Nesidiocoris tenuis]|uniref:Tube fusion n=1 Tax=Nesidiocoris tenuis TaxID=355587 RepID=A0ABN7ABJ2_9HEMI|nr:tube fusion [Nesidiocoris tenuis]
MERRNCIWCLVTLVWVYGTTNAFCPTSCSCDEELLVVSCVEGNLDVIPITLNPSIQRLALKYNKVKTVDAAFTFYGELQYVDLSYNHLVSIPMRSFESQKKLVELHLNHNKISAITNKTFDGLRKLTVLSLRGNFLEDLPDKLFNALPLLEELDLGQNRINRIDSTAFSGLTALRVLYLDDNQLRVVPTPCFPLLASLAELHVGLNAFTILSDDSFKGLNRLTILNLSGAGLVNISDNAFRSLNALRNLVLTDNRLTKVPTKQLSMLNRLEELAIGQNDFSTLPVDGFKGLVNLRKLDITGASSLEKVEKGALSENLNLETLVLSSNKKLVELEDGTLGGLPNLRHLVLRDNAFVTFQESLVAWPELRKLDVSENPLFCSCKLLWLRELLIRRNGSQVLCAQPPTLKDKSLKVLTPDELGCALSGQWTAAVIGGVSGAAVAFGLLVVLVVRYRRRFQDAFKDYKWNKRAMARKEQEYQKTFTDEDVPNFIIPQGTMRPIPVTEL